MAWNGYGGRLVFNWEFRKTVSAFSFLNSDFPPGTRCGGITSFCTILVSNGALTASASSDTPLGAWTDSEQLTGNVASAVRGLAVTDVTSHNGNCQINVSSTTGLTAGNPVLIEFIGGATECNAQTTISSMIAQRHSQFPLQRPIPIPVVATSDIRPFRLGERAAARKLSSALSVRQSEQILATRSRRGTPRLPIVLCWIGSSITRAAYPTPSPSKRRCSSPT